MTKRHFLKIVGLLSDFDFYKKNILCDYITDYTLIIRHLVLILVLSHTFSRKTNVLNRTLFCVKL